MENKKGTSKRKKAFDLSCGVWFVVFCWACGRGSAFRNSIKLIVNYNNMIGEIIAKKRDFLKATIQAAKNEMDSLDKQEKNSLQAGKGMEKWLGNEFQSSSGLTEEFAEFAKDFKKEIKKELQGFELVNVNRGHFYMSGFVKNITTGKMAYFSTSDVRFFKDEWYYNMLIRTAQHDKDYSGGSNFSADWHNVLDRMEKLTS